MALDTSRRQPQLLRALLPLGLVFLAVGISVALVGPFLSLFLSTEVDASPLQITVFLVVNPLAGVVGSTVVGRLSDRHPIRRALLIIGGLAGVAGCVATAFVRDYWILLALAVTAFAIAGSLFPQSFAYARQVLERDAPDKAALGISALRTVFSLAWVAGPAVAAYLVEAGGFRLVYGVAAVMYALATFIGVFWLREVHSPALPRPDDHVEAPVPAGARWLLLLSAAAFTLMQAPLTLGIQALPLFISEDLGGRVSQAGLVLGLCAALEIPFMLAIGALTTRLPLRPMLLAGATCGVAYYALAAVSTGVPVLLGGQVLNALFISATSALGITYMQDLLPEQPGRATTLFTNSFPLGAMLAGPLFGLAQGFGWRFAYWMCAGLCLVGLLMLVVLRSDRMTRER
ncbi:sugar efflux transporter [Symbioplanes lichenis]|uniref:sugar efflux transporter n=1 Tax=Symbioplanes lichenis TaxID=1629072 RepID=UPI00273A5685|nr:sugar efflux transporter [Actinoplanes lichenis]